MVLKTGINWVDFGPNIFSYNFHWLNWHQSLQFKNFLVMIFFWIHIKYSNIWLFSDNFWKCKLKKKNYRKQNQQIRIDFHCKNHQKKIIIVQINLIGQKIEFENSHFLTFWGPFESQSKRLFVNNWFLGQNLPPDDPCPQNVTNVVYAIGPEISQD